MDVARALVHMASTGAAHLAAGADEELELCVSLRSLNAGIGGVVSESADGAWPR